MRAPAELSPRGAASEPESASEVRSILLRAISSLFSLPRLPGNPCHWLCVQLRAHEERSALWASRRGLCATRPLGVQGAAAQLARAEGRDAAQGNVAWGLPQLVGATEPQGLATVVCACQSLPEAAFPRSTKELGDYGVHSLLSLRAGVTAFFRGAGELGRAAAAGTDFPGALETQVDMVVGGPNVGGALEAYAAVIGSDVRDLYMSEHHVLRGVSMPTELAGHEELRAPLGEMVGQASSSVWAPEEVMSQPRDFMAAVKRCASTKCRVTIHAVVAVNLAHGDAQQGARQGGAAWRYVLLTKHHVFHFRYTPRQRASSREETAAYVRNFAGSPFEALYGGVFMDSGAATSYARLFARGHGLPLDDEHPKRVIDALQDRLLHESNVGAHLQVVQTAHLIALLESPVGGFELNRADENGYTPEEYVEAGVIVEELLSGTTAALNGGASAFEAIANECVALRVVLAAEPTQHAATRLGAARAQLRSIADRAQRIFINAPLADFSGVAGLVGRALRALRADETLVSAPLARTARQLAALGDICEAAALTLAEALPRRCKALARRIELARQLRPAPPPPPPAVVELLGALVASSVRTSSSASAQYAAATELDVGEAVKESRTRRTVPPAVAQPAVCMQYAVAHRLDDALAEVHRAVTTPPVPLNPFPCALRVIRARATAAEVPSVRQPARATEAFANELFQTASGPVYGARWDGWDSPAAAAEAAAVAAAAGVNTPAVYGTYAAVHAAHVEATLRAAALLGESLTVRRAWQMGAYAFEVAAGLSGDLSMGNALRTGERPPPPGSAGTRETMPMLQVHIEELHVCSGIDLRRAAELFAESLVARAEELQGGSKHIVESISTGGFSRGMGDTGEARKDWPLWDVSASARLRERCVAELAAQAVQGRDVTLRMVARAGRGYVPLRIRCRLHLIGGEPKYDPSAYSTVFLSPEDANLFLTMGRASGDPGAPVHRDAAAAALAEELETCRLRGDLLGVHRAMLKRCCVTQDFSRVGYAGRVLRSHALEIRLMRASGRALARLAEVRDDAVRRKLQPAAAVTTLAAYTEGCATLLESPQCSASFTGVRPRALWALAAARKQVGGAGMGALRTEDSVALRRVNVWLKACEYGIASALHDANDGSDEDALGMRN